MHVRSSMQDQIALGAQRSPSPVKGGIARTPGSRKLGMDRKHDVSMESIAIVRTRFLPMREEIALDNQYRI
jgi:hypothetical protein